MKLTIVIMIAMNYDCYAPRCHRELRGAIVGLCPALRCIGVECELAIIITMSSLLILYYFQGSVGAKVSFIIYG